MLGCARMDAMPKTLTLASIALLAALVLGSGPAYAHAALVSSDPSEGSRLDKAPTSVTLTFNEPVGKPAYVAVTGPDGSSIKTTDISAVDKVVTATVAAADMKGTFTLSYRVVSTDSHPVEGSTTYDVTTGRTVEQVEPKAEESFVHRHQSHLLWGFGGAVIAIGLLLWPLRGKKT